MLGWQPSERTTLLLKDHSDYGTVAAGTMPRNRLTFDVSPISHEFETYPASERFYSWMNHELFHVAQGDLANDDDNRYRRLFLGKVSPMPAYPESLV
jgi:hypothetical protein